MFFIQNTNLDLLLYATVGGVKMTTESQTARSLSGMRFRLAYPTLKDKKAAAAPHILSTQGQLSGSI